MKASYSIVLFFLSFFTFESTYSQNINLEIIDKMIAAHGGLENWKSIKGMSWEREHFFYRNGEITGNVFMVENVEKGTRRIYQQWPKDNSIIVYDGKEVWSVNWHKPFPPKMVVGIGYALANLPWITQDKSVNLGKPEMVENIYPGNSEKYYAVKMNFKDSDDDLLLFINPETYLVEGCEFYFTDGAFLDIMGIPKEIDKLGPNYYMIKKYTHVNGLKLPSDYITFGKEGEIQAKGTYQKWSLSNLLPKSVDFSKPKNAIVDKSPKKRISKNFVT